MSAQTSRRPWHVGPHYKTDVESADGRVCECRGMNSPRGIADAELVVRSVNNHEALLDALRAFCDDYESTSERIPEIQAAYLHALKVIAKPEAAS